MRLRIITLVLFLTTAMLWSVSPICAADVLHRLTHGDQYSLALGTITSVSDSGVMVEIAAIISGESLPDVINVEISGAFIEAVPAMSLAPGEYAVFSLNQGAETYTVAWGFFKASSLDITTLEILAGPLPEGDLAAFQWYINSGGVENDFYFIGTTAYVRRPDGTSLQIYPPLDEADESLPDAGTAANEEETARAGAATPLAATAAIAQESKPELSLRLTRDFGYGMGGELQGTLSLHASGPDDLARVEFFMDDESMGELTAAPFRRQFNTENYPPGVHKLRAVGYTAEGRELHSNVITPKFLSKAEADQKTTQIIVPLVGGIFGLMALGFLLTFLTSRRRGPAPAPGTPRNYGLAGGAICPKCGRPFARHMWAPNLVTGKLERCPYCGKWSIAMRASPDMLAAAEAAELTEAGEQPAPTLSEEERLQRELENSRYQEG
ncbi:MAG TPA: Ig-like domain-containing protein [Anaerolineae bacterium]|nr:Ig-like domain-containing protein [Anaerolineae bacterium]